MTCKNCMKYKNCADRKQVHKCLSKLGVLGILAKRMIKQADREINKFLGKICKNYVGSE